jgi:acyl-CoA thioesterase
MVVNAKVSRDERWLAEARGLAGCIDYSILTLHAILHHRATLPMKLGRASRRTPAAEEVLLVAKKFPMKSDGFHPFGELIGLSFVRFEDGFSQCVLEVDEKLFNPHKVLHGGVVYTMADTGMGAAVYTSLNEDELCATAEIKIAYFAPVTSGLLTCDTKVVHRGKGTAFLESEVRNGEDLVAKATGSYSIFPAKEGGIRSV